MQDPASSEEYNKEDHRIIKQPEMLNRQSNVSAASQISFNGESKKPKSKSFNRKKGLNSEQNSSVLKIYRDLQYAPEIRNILKKFCYLDRQKVYKISVGELKGACEKELKRIHQIKLNNVEVQNFMVDQNLQQTDNELSIITLTCHIQSIMQAKSQNKPNLANGTNYLSKTVSRQYENMLLDVQKSDQLIRNFINTNLKLTEPSELNIAQCKNFFKKQVAQMNSSSDRVIVSRKTLCQIIVFLCRLLEGQILAFQDVYEYQQQIIMNQYQQTQNGRRHMQNKATRNKQVKVRNLDQSFSQQNSSKDQNILKSRQRDWNDLSSRDLGLKVNQLAGICEQIPQLESFTRTLKFSKITLQNRQSFFKIVDVIIALHHKIGYLSRNKPTLLRQIEDIESELSQIHESVRIFVNNLISQVPSFHQLSFNREKEDSQNQMSQTLLSLRKDLRKLADVISDQNTTQQYLYERLDLMRALIQSFYQSIIDGDQVSWEQFLKKLSNKDLDDQQNQTIQWLNQCLGIIENEIKNNQRNQSEIQTERKLQAQVHTLLADYQKLRAQHQNLQGKFSVIIDEKEEMLMDIQERDKMITNLTNLKTTVEKRERSMREELIIAQQDRRGFEQIIDDLQCQLQRVAIQNQNSHKNLIYEHQDQIKQLVDKIAQLQRAKMQILQKYETQCIKSIQNLHGSNNVNLQLQSLKQRLQRKTKQLDDLNRKFKDTINNLQKQNQELKNQKSIIQNKLEYAEKNKNRLMQKLDEVNNKYTDNVKDFEQKYEDQMITMKQTLYKMQKQLQKYKRNATILTDEVEQLKSQLSGQTKTCNEYRQKLLQFSTSQTQYDALEREYERLIDNYKKLQNNNQSLKQKQFQISNKHEQYLDQIAKGKDIAKKLEKNNKQTEIKLEETINIYDGLDRQFKEQLKINKALQKKISDLEAEIQSLQDSVNSKQRSQSSLLSKSQQRYQQLDDETKKQIQILTQKLKQQQKQNQKTQKTLSNLQKQLRQNTADFKSKEEQFQWTRKENQKKIAQKEQRQKQLEQDQYNTSILIQVLKQEKSVLQLRISELENLQREKQNLTKSIQRMQQNQHKLQGKIDRLQDEVRRLYQQIQKLKQNMQQKQRQIQASQESFLLQQREFNQQQQQRQSQASSNQIIKLRQQIIRQKTTIIHQNNKLREQNNQLHDEIDKLKRVNEILQNNIKKMEQHSSNTSGELQSRELEHKESLNRYAFQQSNLQSQMELLKNENKLLKKNNEQLKSKFQQKCKVIIEKDTLLFEKDLQKNNSDKFNKQLKYKIQDLQNTILSLTQAIDKLKNSKIKALQAQIENLNDQIADYKRKDETKKTTLAELEAQIQRLKKDSFKKNELLRSEKHDLQDYYQNLLRKIQAQHSTELNDTDKKARKQTQNDFNQLLIKEKQNFNNISISKIQQLGEIQKKYEKLIKDERNQKNNIQQEYNQLLRQFNQHKKNRSLNASRLSIEEAQNGKTQEQLQRLRTDYESLKRQSTRFSLENQRLQKDLMECQQQNASILTKNMELQHTISLLNAKTNQLNINLQSTRKSLQNMMELERQKMSLERQLQKSKSKSISDEAKINDSQGRIQQLEKRIVELEAKVTSYRSKQFEWSNNSSEWSDKNRSFVLQISEFSQKITHYQRELLAKEQRLKQKQNQSNNSEQQFNKKLRNWQDKERNYKEIQNSLSRMSGKYENQSHEWTQKEQSFKQEIEKLLRKLKQLQFQVQNSKNIGQQSSKLVIDFTNLSRNHQALQDRFSRLENDLNRIKAEKQSLQRQKQSLQAQINRLNRQKDGLQNARNLIWQDNQKWKTLNEQLHLKINQLNNELHVIVLKNNTYKNQLAALSNSSRKESQIEEQMRKLRQFYENQMKNQQIKLKDQFEEQKKTIVYDCEQVLKSMNETLQKQEKKNSQLLQKISLLIRQKEEMQNMLEKMRRQNMQLSDYCKTYEEKVQSLQNDQKAKGSLSVDFQSKYRATMQEKSKSEEDKRLLQGQLQKLINQNRLYLQRIQEVQSQRNKADYERKNLQNNLGLRNGQITQLTNEISTLKSRILELQIHIKDLQHEKKSSRIERQSQDSLDLQRLQTQLALTRQEMLRLHQVIKKKQSDFQNQIKRLTEQKAVIYRDNQMISTQYQTLKIKITHLQTVIQGKDRQIAHFKGQNENLLNQSQKLKHGQELKLNQSRLKEDQNKHLQSETARLQTQVAIVKMQYEHLNSQYNKLSNQLQSLNQQNTKLHLQVGKQKSQNDRIYHQTTVKDQHILHQKTQIDRLSIQILSKSSVSSNVKGDLNLANMEITNLKNSLNSLQRQHNQLHNQILTKDKILSGMNHEINQGKQVMLRADSQIKKTYEERNKLLEQVKHLSFQNQNHLAVIKSRQNQNLLLKQIISTLQQELRRLNESKSKQIAELKIIIDRLQSSLASAQVRKFSHDSSNELNVNQSLNQSRSSINLVTKSYSYQGGQVTVAELNRLQEENRRLIKEIQGRDKVIQKNKYQIESLYKQVKILKEQIQLLSEGKTINLKGYTRVTNPNDASLNPKGVLYTQYDIRQFKGKIQLLEKSLSIYQNRETELLKQIEKYKYRQRAYLDQIKTLELSNSYNGANQGLPEMMTSSPTKKTSFDQGFARANYPQSSTYKIQSGIEMTHRSVNMNSNEKYFLRTEGLQLRKTIQRISNCNLLMSSKVDEILQNSRKTTKQSLQQVLTVNQFNIPSNFVNQIRDLIHQNKALVQALRSLKQNREDVNLLIQEYIDPEYLTQFVYRILIYFSEVEDQSQQAKSIRVQLNQIRNKNVGGYYFTVLQQFTKYIIEHNSIQVYKEELRQKAQQLLGFKEKFQILIDSKIGQTDKLLKKSGSKGSLLGKSRGIYIDNSRVKFQYSDAARSDFSKNKDQSNYGTGSRVIAGNQLQLPQTHVPNSISLHPTLITVSPLQRSRATSHLIYSPYNQQVLTSTTESRGQQIRSQNQSLNEVKNQLSNQQKKETLVHETKNSNVIYSTKYESRTNTNVSSMGNSSNSNYILRTNTSSLQRK